MKRCLLAGAAIQLVLGALSFALAADWPQWGGSDGRNMASLETGLPAKFVAGTKKDSTIDLVTTENVRWATRLGDMACGTPVVANGRVFVGASLDQQGVLVCLDERSGKILWRMMVPCRSVPKEIEGRKFWYQIYSAMLGITSSPAVEGDRLYVVSHRCEVLCLDVLGMANGNDGPFRDEAHYLSHAAHGLRHTTTPDIIWLCDLWKLGVRPSDASNCSVLVHGDFVYVGTSNGVDRDSDASKKDQFRKPPAPDAPTLVVLDKKTGRIVAIDDARIGPRMLHGQWSSPSLGVVNGKTLVFYGAGDGLCYAFEALATAPAESEEPVKLKIAWSFDCNPPEYKQFGKYDRITHYCLGDRRRSDNINKNDGSFVGMSEIIATPVFHKNRVYVAIGRDPEHGRGRGALWCIDATKSGDITSSGKVWCYQGLDRSMSTVSIYEDLLYVADVAGRLHCLDVNTGHCHWIYESGAKVWASTLAADGRVYLPTEKGLHVLAAGKEKKFLSKINLGAPLWASPVVANGKLYITSTHYLWAVGKLK